MKVDRLGPTNVSVAELASLELKEMETGPIWIAFQSPAGKKYEAVHWIRRSDKSAIRLISKDKDKDDFMAVARSMRNPMMVAPKETIMDRGDDLCQDLEFTDLPDCNYFNQWVAERVYAFYAKSFANVTIDRVYVDIPLVLNLKKDGTLIIGSIREKSESDSILVVRTAFREMELREGGDIIVRSKDERWKKQVTLLLGERFGHQRVRAGS